MNKATCIHIYIHIYILYWRALRPSTNNTAASATCVNPHANCIRKEVGAYIPKEEGPTLYIRLTEDGPDEADKRVHAPGGEAQCHYEVVRKLKLN